MLVVWLGQYSTSFILIFSFVNMKIHIITILSLLSITSLSQNTFNYLGTLILSNNTPISFKLELTEKKGVVNGFSITKIGLNKIEKSKRFRDLSNTIWDIIFVKINGFFYNSSDELILLA